MDWTGLGLRDDVIGWLEAAATARYAQDRRLDPFATSMRDFDDASTHLKSIRGGRPPATNDPGQRIADLKKAGFVATSGEELSDLGTSVLDAWERFGIDTDAKADELARLLIMALEARSTGNKDFEAFFEYWSDLRMHFEPLDLIQNWDSLYQINYLDFERGGFLPGAVYRDEKVAVADIEFDLADYARDTVASPLAMEGGERIEDAISGKLPRGRHRATFCMALEIVLSDGQSTAAILGNFGFPKKPGLWVPFNEAQKTKVEVILGDYGETTEQLGGEAVIEVAAEQSLAFVANPAPVLPSHIDFSTVLVDPPKLPGHAASSDGKGGGGPKKVDHQQKAQANDAVGKLGEVFAMAYERWRLRNHPELLKKLKHVSTEDDTLGYDIESFETNGTPRFVEVKGTLGPMETRFFLSAAEFTCAEAKSSQYLILRVACLTDAPECCEIRFPFEGKLDLIPATYSASFTGDVSAGFEN